MRSDAVQPTAGRARPSISVIMPCYNARRYLGLSLPPLIAMARSGDVDEVIVADDGSTDESASMAAEAGARIVHTGKRSGPGAARNEAAKMAIGDVLWFVDADVVVHRGAASRAHQAFEKEDIVAIFGSYDDAPPAQNFASQYKNLIHHYYHQKGQREASTFWAGCGAVRKAAFLNAGGFDVARYPYPSIEDIELGHRLCASGGRIALDPQMLSTHLKVWSIGGVIHTDILRALLPLWDVSHGMVLDRGQAAAMAPGGNQMIKGRRAAQPSRDTASMAGRRGCIGALAAALWLGAGAGRAYGATPAASPPLVKVEQVTVTIDTAKR